MKLVAFDGDDTLWTPTSGVNLSDRTPTDDLGHPSFTYHLIDDDPLIARRDDGALFALRPEAKEVIEALRAQGLLVGVVSYNHETNVRSILDTFGLLDCIDYIVAEWHTHKDRMLDKMLAAARRDGHVIDARDVLLVDDDPAQIYRGQCERMGVGFRRFGSDITDLREVLSL
jgi:HAD superfamily phosphatase (TIGR01681 family)